MSEITFRQMADACCDICRALEGEGPWCPRCGAEMPGVESSDMFTDDLCDDCEANWRVEGAES